jgi:hypothetical protein
VLKLVVRFFLLLFRGLLPSSSSSCSSSSGWHWKAMWAVVYLPSCGLCFWKSSSSCSSALLVTVCVGGRLSLFFFSFRISTCVHGVGSPTMFLLRVALCVHCAVLLSFVCSGDRATSRGSLSPHRADEAGDREALRDLRHHRGEDSASSGKEAEAGRRSSAGSSPTSRAEARSTAGTA